MNRVYKLTFERINPDHPGEDVWFPYCMDSFGRGYSFKEADALKAHLESKPEMYRNVKIEPMCS